ncbi:unnamed protein product [Penicillium glandicola]
MTNCSTSFASGARETQLAIEYANQVRRESPEIWVFWVNANKAARLETSLRDLANRAKIPRHQDCSANIFQLVRNWLQDGGIGKLVLILDNVDDDELLHKLLDASTQPPLRHLLGC